MTSSGRSPEVRASTSMRTGVVAWSSLSRCELPWGNSNLSPDRVSVPTSGVRRRGDHGHRDGPVRAVSVMVRSVASWTSESWPSSAPVEGGDPGGLAGWPEVVGLGGQQELVEVGRARGWSSGTEPSKAVSRSRCAVMPLGERRRPAPVPSRRWPAGGLASWAPVAPERRRSSRRGWWSSPRGCR